MDSCYEKSYEDSLAWIHSLQRFGSNLGLERISLLLEKLGNPQHKLRCVHIAGTNGKGSTAAFLASVLEAQGFRVGLYTSPYLESFTNRMGMNGEDISREELVRLVSEIRPQVEAVAATDAGQPTEFEVVTALGFLYFARSNPDWVVVEVGLGGRLDATNVIIPAVSVITNIGFDHTEVLGDTIGAIAWEKGGIIKQGVPVVTAAEKTEALQVFRRLSAERNSALYELDKDFFCEIKSVSLEGLIIDYKSKRHRLDNLAISLLGRHQAGNAALAVAALELMPVPFDEEAIRRGLRATYWPGRLEVFSRHPLVVVDGAHNTEGILALRGALREILGGRDLHIIFGVLGDKAVEEILSVIAPMATAGFVVTKPNSPRAADPYLVARKAAPFLKGVAAVVEENIHQAVADTLPRLRRDEALCICGSLYAISEARNFLKKYYQIDGRSREVGGGS